MELTLIGNPIKQGQPVAFKAGTDLKLGRGWSGPEPDFCWTDGVFSEVRFMREDDAGASTLLIDCNPKIRSEQGTQVLIFSNGKLAVAQIMFERMQLAIPVARGEVTIDLLIWVPGATSYASPRGNPPDYRCLGVCVHSVRLE